MKTLLIIGLIYSLIIYAYKIIAWIFISYHLIKKSEKYTAQLKSVSNKISPVMFIYGGAEHFVIFASILASLIIIW